MNLFRKIRYKTYYIIARHLLRSKHVQLPVSLSSKRNVFIYFDYEREFGNPMAQITDADISKLLQLLDSQNIKTTWFTVGKIFQSYPDSIKNILCSGHEIASHSFNHISPYHSRPKELKNDFELFENHSASLKNIKGYHAPKGRWNLKSHQYLERHGYTYELVGTNKNRIQTLFVKGRSSTGIYRLNSLGDDWPLYKRDLSAAEVFEYFKGLFNRIYSGNIAGIGIHPWVLFRSDEMFKGFEQFINYIKTQEACTIKTALEFVELLQKSDEN